MANQDRDLNHLQPFFKAKVEAWLAALKAEGIELKVTETLRSFARQEELFALGRTKPGVKVTNARAGQSNHHWGLAVDCYPIDDNPETVNLEVALGKPVINFDRYPHLMTAMKRAAEVGMQFYVDWGGAWKTFRDYPHFQLIDMPSLSALRALYPHGYRPGESKPITG